MKVKQNAFDWPKHLRLLVNKECNYQCSFPGTKCEWCHKDGIHVNSQVKSADISDFLFLAQTLKEPFKLEKLKIGAMEPTLFSGVETIVSEAKKMKFDEVSLTSNGYLLANKLAVLEEAGLDTLTVSMHAFNPEVYRSVTGIDGFERVKKTVEKASQMNFKTVKINRVLLNFDNIWEDLMAFFKWAAKFGIRIKLYQLIWSKEMDPKQYFDNFVSWKALHLYFKNNGQLIETNKFLIPGRERMVWRMKDGLEIETDVFYHKLSEGTGKVCQNCPEVANCQEGLMSYGLEVNPELTMAGCLLRNDLLVDLWSTVKERNKQGLVDKVNGFLRGIV